MSTAVEMRLLWGGASFLNFAIVLLYLTKAVHSATREAVDQHSRTSLRAMLALTLVLWNAYPGVWLLAELNMLTPATEQLLWAILDYAAKVGKARAGGWGLCLQQHYCWAQRGCNSFGIAFLAQASGLYRIVQHVDTQMADHGHAQSLLAGCVHIAVVAEQYQEHRGASGGRTAGMGEQQPRHGGGQAQAAGVSQGAGPAHHVA